MDRRNRSTKNWSNISDSSPTKEKMIGWGCCHLQNSSITTRFILLLNTLLSSLTLGVFLGWALNRTNLGPMWNPSMSSDTRWRTPWRKQRRLWPSQQTTWRSTTTRNNPRLQRSKQGIWSSSMLVTSRPLNPQRSFLTEDWNRSQLIVKLVMVCTSSAFLGRWVDFIPSLIWSNYLWLLRHRLLALLLTIYQPLSTGHCAQYHSRHVHHHSPQCYCNWLSMTLDCNWLSMALNCDWLSIEYVDYIICFKKIYGSFCILAHCWCHFMASLNNLG